MYDVVVPLLVMAASFIAAYLVAGVIIRYSSRKRDRRELERPLGSLGWYADPPKEASGNLYCRDCGTMYVSVRMQDGFDRKTGEPVFSYQRGCSAGLRMNPPRWPDCSNRAVQSYVALAHNHPDPTATATTCPVCVDQMVADKVITPLVALKLYSAVKAEPGRRLDYSLSPWTAGMLAHPSLATRPSSGTSVNAGRKARSSLPPPPPPPPPYR